MAKAKLIKSFTNRGKTYRVGDEFEGTDAEIESLTSQGYIKRQDNVPIVDPGPGKGVNTSASSSGDTGNSFQKTAAAAKIQAKLARR